jgi:iron complex outermembrane receptor protein
LTYSAGVEFDVRPASMVYAKYSTGYQPGGVNSMGLTPKPTLEQVTVGIKNRFFDNKLQFNIEAFNTQYHDRPVQGGIGSVQLSSSVSTTCTLPTGFTASFYLEVNTNGSGCLQYTGTATAPNVISRGVDMELNFLPTANDRIDLSVEFLDSSYQSTPALATGVALPTTTAVQALPVYTSVGTTTGTVSAAQSQTLVTNLANGLAAYNGAVLQNAARWSGNLSYTHGFQLTNGSQLTLKLSAAFRSRYWTLNGPSANIGLANAAIQSGTGRYDANGRFAPGIQPSYKLFDAFLTWQPAGGKYTIATYVKNIGNLPVLAGASTVTVAGGTIPRQIYLLAPRTFGASISASF